MTAPHRESQPGNAQAFCDWLRRFFADCQGKDELTATEANTIRGTLNAMDADTPTPKTASSGRLALVENLRREAKVRRDHPDDYDQEITSWIEQAAVHLDCDVLTEQEPVAWWAYCEKTGGQMVMTSGLKDMLIEEADRIYAEDGYVLRPLYAASPLPSADRGSK